MTDDELNAIVFKALRLCVDDKLEWSNDFDEIRPYLCSILLKAMSDNKLRSEVIGLANKIASLT